MYWINDNTSFFIDNAFVYFSFRKVKVTNLHLILSAKQTKNNCAIIWNIMYDLHLYIRKVKVNASDQLLLELGRTLIRLQIRIYLNDK